MDMKVKEKICKNPTCGKSFFPYSSFQKGCKPTCERKIKELKEKEKKAKVREKKKVSISSLSKVCDVLWSKYIRLKALKCEYCGTSDNLNAHHIFTRHSKNTRWESLNGICLCAKHHTFSDEFSAHKTPVEFTYWLEETRGKDFINDLRQMANTPMKVTPEYLQDKIEYYKEIIKILESNK